VSEPFRIRVKVRSYEVDTQGHLNWAEYLHYAEQARWEHLAAAGISQDALLATGVGPVVLDVKIAFKRELRGGDEVDVSCQFNWGDGKTFQVVQDLTRADGRLAAALTSTGGFIDLNERRLIADPVKHLRSIATVPAIIGC